MIVLITLIDIWCVLNCQKLWFCLACLTSLALLYGYGG